MDISFNLVLNSVLADMKLRLERGIFGSYICDRNDWITLFFRQFSLSFGSDCFFFFQNSSSRFVYFTNYFDGLPKLYTLIKLWRNKLIKGGWMGGGYFDLNFKTVVTVRERRMDVAIFHASWDTPVTLRTIFFYRIHVSINM